MFCYIFVRKYATNVVVFVPKTNNFAIGSYETIRIYYYRSSAVGIFCST